MAAMVTLGERAGGLREIGLLAAGVEEAVSDLIGSKSNLLRTSPLTNRSWGQAGTATLVKRNAPTHVRQTKGSASIATIDSTE